jgi:polyphosphate glucokinase
MKVLGIDVGGSALKGAPVDTRSGRLLADRVRVETPELVSPKRMAEIVAEITRHFAWRGPIGLGFPGVIQHHRALTSANLDPRFVGTDLAGLFRRASHRPVHVLNDADAAGLAEMKFGAGRHEAGVVLLLTLGTGVGSALFFRGTLFPNSELGHLPMGETEAEKLVAASIRTEESLSWSVWGKRLDAYLAVLENVLWPELIILGGGISAKFDHFARYLKRRTPIVPASFHNEAGIVGAAMAAARERKK